MFIRLCFTILIISVLLPSLLFSQDAETPEDYIQSKGVLNYNYYGFPFFIEGGYEYRKNSSQVLFPLVGVSFENGLYGVNLFATARMIYRYERFYFQLGFKQGLIPNVGESYKYENLESYGQFKIGHYFENVNVSYNLDAGNKYARNLKNRVLSNIFQINHSIGIYSLLYSDAANTLSLDSSLNIETMPNTKQYSYSFSAKMPYTFYHYWGEFSIVPYLSYGEYFENSKKNYSIGGGYLNSLMMAAVTGSKEPYKVLYNFLSYMHLEYRFYLRFLPDAFSSIYFVAYGNIGYGKEVEQSLNDGTMLYTAGGGIGYSLFGTVPMQLTVGVDRLNNVVINYAISTTIHRF